MASYLSTFFTAPKVVEGINTKDKELVLTNSSKNQQDSSFTSLINNQSSSNIASLIDEITVSEEGELLENFTQAEKTFKEKLSFKVDENTGLKFYGLYKQAKEGSCKLSQPGMFDVVGRTKYDAWMKFSSISKTEAMKTYISNVNELLITVEQDKKVKEVKTVSVEVSKPISNAPAVSTHGDVFICNFHQVKPHLFPQSEGIYICM
jgi:acyl-CoA-binding protein